MCIRDRYETQTFDALRRDNYQLSAAIKFLQEQLTSSEAVRDVKDRTIGRLNAEIVRQKKISQEKEELIQRIEKEYAQQNVWNEVKKKGKEKEEIVQAMTAELQKKDEVITKLEETISDLKIRMQNMEILERTEKQAAKYEIDRLKSDLDALTAEVDILQRRNALYEHLLNINNIPFARQLRKTRTSIESPTRVDKSVLKKLARIRSDEVQPIGRTLSLRFQIAKLSFEELEKRVFTQEVMEKGVISIEEMDDILRSDPIRMEDKEQALFVARYLIEDNTEEYLQFDRTRACDVNVVKSIFKKFIGNYKLLTHEEDKQLRSEVSAVKLT
eukprot:TRINITY_DN8575_c0_g1_i3.p1 TRINITY_DN8575_c0_g1~~TRINITY_DN8575_c0_g1_i3.p1  ORF type:complete len:329 (-),score=106.93 TRINITY_DN8575_c0_g1_i3:464-1450(-)